MAVPFGGATWGSIIRATKPYSLRHQPHRFGQLNHVTSHLSEGAWSRPGLYVAEKTGQNWPLREHQNYLLQHTLL